VQCGSWLYHRTEIRPSAGVGCCVISWMITEEAGPSTGVEVDVDEGYLVESTSEARDEEVLAVINVGIINKVKEYARTGRYDGIVLTGGIDPGLWQRGSLCRTSYR